MTYIVWKDSFNIGLKEMDEQHKLFVSYINELYEAMRADNAEASVVPIYNKLTDYIQTHFSTEENILISTDYPMLETQKKQHAFYVSELTFLKSSVLEKHQTAQNMLLFLKDWFLHHITTEDLKYVESVKKFEAESSKFV